MMWDNNYSGWGMHDGSGLAWVTMAVLFVLLIGLAVALATAFLKDSGSAPQTQQPTPADNEAERILRRRFAAGEIDEDELHRRQAALAEHVT